MDIGKIRRNVTAISEGHWVEKIPGAGDLRLKVRGMSSPAVRDCRTRHERAVGSDGRSDDGLILPDVSMKILSETLIEAVLLDWDNLSLNGEPVEYSMDLAREWLSNPEFEEFGDAVVWAAHSVDRLRLPYNKEAVGN